MQTSHTSLTIDVCRCDMDVVIGMASSLGTFILSSTVFLTVGLTCGYYHGRKRIKQQSHGQDPTVSVYEHINMKYKQQESELMDNVAYNCIDHSSKCKSELIENVAYNCVSHSSK